MIEKIKSLLFRLTHRNYVREKYQKLTNDYKEEIETVHTNYDLNSSYKIRHILNSHPHWAGRLRTAEMMIYEKTQAIKQIVNSPEVHKENQVQIEEAYGALIQALEFKRFLVAEHKEELNENNRDELSKEVFITEMAQKVSIEYIAKSKELPFGQVEFLAQLKDPEVRALFMQEVLKYNDYILSDKKKQLTE